MSQKRKNNKYNYKKMADEIIEYSNKCSIKNLPFFASLCKLKGWNYHYLWRIAKQGEHKEFTDAVDYLHATREDFILKGLITGDINPTVGIFLLKATCNYSDRPENEVLKLELQADDPITKAMKETFLENKRKGKK